MDPVSLFISGLLIAIAVWTVAMARLRGSDELAIVVVLGCLATAANLIVPLPNLELTTSIVVCTAAALSLRAAVAVGALAAVATGATAGLGIWVAWQVVGFALLAVAAWAIASSLRGMHLPTSRQHVALAVASGVLTIAFDIVVTVGGLTSAGLLPNQTITQILIAGAPFTVLHAAGTITVMLILGPALTRALTRARVRVSA